MSKSENIKPIVTPEELALLMGTTKKEPSGVDSGFKYRNAFLLIVSFGMVVRLLFFPSQALLSFGFPPSMDNMAGYFQARGWYALVVSLVYLYSYLKDWYFSRVALIVATLAFAGLVSDFFNVYRFVIGPLTPSVIFMVALRIGAVYCMFMNSIRDNRAPPMPRHMFS